MKRSLIEFDLEAVSGCSGIAGVDEAGRGALAGRRTASRTGFERCGELSWAGATCLVFSSRAVL